MPFLVDLAGIPISHVAGAHPIVPRARDWHLAQIHADVDQVLSQSRKTDKVASRDVARSLVDWNTFHTTICPLLAVRSHVSAVLRENSYASKITGNDCVSYEQRDRDSLPRTVALKQQRADAGPSAARVHRLRRSDPAEEFPRVDIRRIAAHSECT